MQILLQRTNTAFRVSFNFFIELNKLNLISAWTRQAWEHMSLLLGPWKVKQKDSELAWATKLKVLDMPGIHTMNLASKKINK